MKLLTNNSILILCMFAALAALVTLVVCYPTISHSDTEFNGWHVVTATAGPSCSIMARPKYDGGVWVQTGKDDNCSMTILVNGELFTGMQLDSKSYDKYNGHTFYYVNPGNRVKVCVRRENGSNNCTEEFTMPPAEAAGDTIATGKKN